jgi:hypothetical protein
MAEFSSVTTLSTAFAATFPSAAVTAAAAFAFAAAFASAAAMTSVMLARLGVLAPDFSFVSFASPPFLMPGWLSTMEARFFHCFAIATARLPGVSLLTLFF